MDCVHQVATGDAQLKEKIAILSVGVPFAYTLPYFDVLAVELRQVKVERQLNDAATTERFDAFIRSDASLDCSYPMSVFVTDAFLIEVSGYLYDG